MNEQLGYEVLVRAVIIGGAVIFCLGLFAGYLVFH
jgi:hypothetical protein